MCIEQLSYIVDQSLYILIYIVDKDYRIFEFNCGIPVFFFIFFILTVLCHFGNYEFFLKQMLKSERDKLCVHIGNNVITVS